MELLISVYLQKSFIITSQLVKEQDLSEEDVENIKRLN